MKRLLLRKFLSCRIYRMSGLSTMSPVCLSAKTLPALTTFTPVRWRHRYRTGNHCDGARLTIRRNPSLLDDPVSMDATGLPANTPVTLAIKLFNEKEKLNFTSTTHYVTNAEGIPDLDMHQYTCTAYTGIDGMAPFWTMKPRSGDWSDRLLVRDVTQPLVYNLQLYLGHLSDEDVFHDEQTTGKPNAMPKTQNLLASCDCERLYMAPGVQRVPVEEDGVFGTMFLPPKDLDGEALSRPRPLVVSLYGGIHKGALIEEKAALLASRGFASFAIGFFGIGTLPRRYETIDIEYFEKAIKLVCHKFKDEVDSEAVALMGISKAGDISLSCAAFLPDLIKAVVVINCSLSSIAYPTLYKDQRVEGLGYYSDASKFKVMDNGLIDMLGIMHDVEDDSKTIIPFYKSPADILWFAGDDDHNFDSAMYARQAKKLAAKEGKTNFEMHIFPGCGHLIDLPFSPPATSSLHPLVPPGVKLYMGGANTIKEHVAAQIHIWRKSLDFLRQKLLKDHRKVGHINQRTSRL